MIRRHVLLAVFNYLAVCDLGISGRDNMTRAPCDALDTIYGIPAVGPAVLAGQRAGPRPPDQLWINP